MANYCRAGIKSLRGTLTISQRLREFCFETGQYFILFNDYCLFDIIGFLIATKMSWLDPDPDLAGFVVSQHPKLDPLFLDYGSTDTGQIPVCELR